MAVVADHDFCARTVVRKKNHQRIFPLTHLADLIEDSTDFNVHAMNHRRVDGHLRRLKLLLLVGKTVPRKRFIDLAIAENFERGGKVVWRAEVAFDSR